MSSQAPATSDRVARNVQAEIERVGLPNAVLARQLVVSERQITRWRNGQAPRWESVVKFAPYFGREPEWFYADHDGVPA